MISSCTHANTQLPLPLNEPLLLHAEVADVRGQLTAKLSDFLFFPKRCPALLHGVSMDTVTEQFSLYQSMDVSTYVKSRMDETWFAIGNIRDKDGIQPLKDLAAVMFCFVLFLLICCEYSMLFFFCVVNISALLV